MVTKVLNLYAGIGGNRKLWEDVDVTAVEWDEEKAEVYHDHFPDDEVIVADAHEYLLDHFEEYDFIWASPPCPTHSQVRHYVNPSTEPVYPDMKLYQEILLLKHNFDGDYVVENVNPYYEPLIEAQKRSRHLFWANFYIPEIELEPTGIRQNTVSGSSLAELEEKVGFDTSGYGLPKHKRLKMVRNCVKPKLGKHIFEAATKNRQTTLSDM